MVIYFVITGCHHHTKDAKRIKEMHVLPFNIRYSLDLQTSIYLWSLRLLHTFVRSRPQKVLVYQNDFFKMFLEELASTHTNLSNL